MKGTIRHLSHVQNSEYEQLDWDEFISWLRDQPMYQFDIETTVTDKWNDKELISMQFGSAQGVPKQYFLQWSELTMNQQMAIKTELEKQNTCKLIHNARFEYIVLRFYGIILENMYDTLIGEKVINGGLESVEYSLADVLWKYLHITLNKEYQTQFGDNIMTDGKIEYACLDVTYLDQIRKLQLEIAEREELMNVISLEMDVLPAFSDITYEGMILDQDKWRENIKLAEPVIDAAYQKLNSYLAVEPFKTHATKKGFICDEDRFVLNMKAWQQTQEVLQWIFPDIIGSSQPIVKKYIGDHAATMTLEQLDVLVSFTSKVKDTAPLEMYLMKYFRKDLISHGYLIPAGMVTINWNSGDQVLPLVQLVEPRLKGLGEDEVAKTSHPILKRRQEYTSALKLTSTYGEEFIIKYVDSDGKVRCSFNQILTTGRVSTSNPNMQNIIVTEEVGTRYRNAFVCERGWSFVDSDYISQELVIIAFLSKDPVWMDCIDNGYDLHSVCAELLYGAKWKEAAADDCAYYKMVIGPDGVLRQAKEKCSCKKHKVLRYDIKAINFGLAYGMTEYKLAGDLEITVREAKKLIAEYFSKFPSIGGMLNTLGEYGVRNGMIKTMWPFNRRRYFPYWKEYKGYIDAHISGIMPVKHLGEIERASKNHPIQGTSADITKVALILIRNYIRDNDLWSVIKLQAQVHDQVTTKAVDEVAKEWAITMDKLMCDAGKVVITSGILRADTNVTPVWTK